MKKCDVLESIDNIDIQSSPYSYLRHCKICCYVIKAREVLDVFKRIPYKNAEELYNP